MATQFSDILAWRKDEPKSPAALANMAVGLFSESPGFAARDVQWVMDYARAHRFSARKEVAALFDLAREAQNAPTEEERDALKRRLREKATALRNEWEKTPPKHKTKSTAAAGSTRAPEGARANESAIARKFYRKR